MIKKLISSELNVKRFINKVIDQNTKINVKIEKEVDQILQKVKKNGDNALIYFAKKFDKCIIKKNEIKIEVSEINKFAKKCPKNIEKALIFAAARIKKFHKYQLPKNYKFTDEKGVLVGSRWLPISSIGIYIPGGTAIYPSSILMNSIPAKIAGVKRIAMVVPQKNKNLNPIIAKAAQIGMVDEIFRIGGAHSIAALAWGTESITPVDKIVGPGNIYVTTAKKKLFGYVGIDMLAGPSEILIVADNKNNSDWIAADLLAQAEHDINSRSTLITNDSLFAKKVLKSIDSILKILPRSKIASSSWKKNGNIIIVKNFSNVHKIINQLSPEHLELAIDKPDNFFEKIKNAGSVFLGRYTPEAIGDYVAGPNHVLPTGSTARFSSGLDVMDFLKKTTFTKCNKKSLKLVSNQAIKLAEAEGLYGHALSIYMRNKI